jgi:hypothetical protein
VAEQRAHRKEARFPNEKLARNVATNMVRNMASNTGTDVDGDRKRNTDVDSQRNVNIDVHTECGTCRGTRAVTYGWHTSKLINGQLTKSAIWWQLA